MYIISFSIFYKVNQYVVGVVGNIINKLVQNMPEDVYFKITIIQLIYILPFVVYITVTYIILHICFNFVKKFFNYRNCNFNTASIFIVLLPAFLGDLIAAMIFGIIILSNDNTKIIYEMFPSLVYIIPAISFCIIVTVILQIYLLNKKILLDEEEGNKMILSNQIDMMKNHLTEIENLYSGIRGIRHDLANHIDNLRYLIKYKNNENADFYMNKMTEAIEKFDFKIKTGNPITDVVVNRKYNILKGKNIKFKSEFYFDEKYIDSFEMAIILDNLLDNAIEAADTFISIKSNKIKNCFFIEVKNDYLKRIIIKNDNIITFKKNKKEHGFGLKNVSKIVDKNNRDIDIQTDNNVLRQL